MKAFLRICAAVLVLSVGLAAKQAANPQAPPTSSAPSTPLVNLPAGRPGRGGGQSPASQKPPETVVAQSYPAEQVQAGQAVFQQQCAFCHGRDAGGGETGPDLTRSTVVAQDVHGDKIAPVVKGGRLDKGMPQFNLSEQDLAAVVAFIHDQKTKAESLLGGRKGVDISDLQTGDATQGQEFFNGAGKCSSCHSPTGDLAGVASRFQGLALMQRMLSPGGRGGPSGTAKVTLPSGEKVAGKLEYRDEFFIALTDSAGRYRSWPADRVKVAIDSPADAHYAVLGKYTDAEMHNVLAYLQTLK